jgi:hypothetical protein
MNTNEISKITGIVIHSTLCVLTLLYISKTWTAENEGKYIIITAELKYITQTANHGDNKGNHAILHKLKTE